MGHDLVPTRLRAGVGDQHMVFPCLELEVGLASVAAQSS